MRLKPTAILVLPAILLAGSLAVAQTTRSRPDAPFGGPEDVQFARKLWKAMDGYPDWKLRSGIYPGRSPHGKFLRLFSTWVTVEGRSHPIIVKDNYGGRGVTPERIEQNPREWLQAVTIMLQREDGYDAENRNWFWVKYGPDGEVLANEQGVKLAGRVAKGMPRGCIACHAQARGEDYLFSND